VILLLIGFQIVLGLVLTPLADWLQSFVAQIVSNTVTAPFIAVVLTLLYFRLRAAKEPAATPETAATG
jgi:phosphate/sulfate permease